MLIQFTGLSGAGKSTLANLIEIELKKLNIDVKIIDADVYRSILSSDLGFSNKDRKENLRRLSLFAKECLDLNNIVIMVAMNPFESTRCEINKLSKNVKTVWINCDIITLIHRDVKGLYYRAFLLEDDPLKIKDLSGINSEYEFPQEADLIINTNLESIEESKSKLLKFILENKTS